MKVNAFDLTDPIPEMTDPHVITMLSPWMDAGRVGTLTLSGLKEYFGAKELGKITTPGRFFDFTRYRPVVHYDGERRVLTIPNSTLSYAKREDGPDLIFFQVLEPHAFAEQYVDSVVEVLKALNVKRHCRVGASYASVPHTRPLPVSHSIGGRQVDPTTGELLPRNTTYQGPTSIMNMVTEKLEGLGVEVMSLTVRLPYYAQLEEDHTGASGILEAFYNLYKLPPVFVDTIALHKSEGDRQYREVSSQIGRDPANKSFVESMEAEYDSQSPNQAPASEPPPPLSPDTEKFLRDITQDMGGA